MKYKVADMMVFKISLVFSFSPVKKINENLNLIQEHQST
jgi:hypothetical protein